MLSTSARLLRLASLLQSRMTSGPNEGRRIPGQARYVATLTAAKPMPRGGGWYGGATLTLTGRADQDINSTLTGQNRANAMLDFYVGQLVRGLGYWRLGVYNVGDAHFRRTDLDEPVDIQARRTENFGGAPYHPTGNPFLAGVGPGAYAQRANWPDIDAHGLPRIVPIGAASGITVAPASTDPRGLSVIGADGKVAGTVTDLWVDRAEHVIRYLAIDTGTGTVLAPMAMATVRRGVVEIDAMNAADFAGAPKPAAAAEITRFEEERIVGYFGAGYLYANTDRQEPWL